MQILYCTSLRRYLSPLPLISSYPLNNITYYVVGTEILHIRVIVDLSGACYLLEPSTPWILHIWYKDTAHFFCAIYLLYSSTSSSFLILYRDIPHLCIATFLVYPFTSHTVQRIQKYCTPLKPYLSPVYWTTSSVHLCVLIQRYWPSLLFTLPTCQSPFACPYPRVSTYS
jgi:hypothetical protein